MATVRAVERKIAQREGFRVVILTEEGRDIRSDRQAVPQYPFERAMKNRSNVKQWKTQRFRETYPGFDVAVLDANGRRVHGGTLLGTVRDSYLDS